MNYSDFFIVIVQSTQHDWFGNNRTFFFLGCSYNKSHLLGPTAVQRSPFGPIPPFKTINHSDFVIHCKTKKMVGTTLHIYFSNGQKNPKTLFDQRCVSQICSNFTGWWRLLVWLSAVISIPKSIVFVKYLHVDEAVDCCCFVRNLNPLVSTSQKAAQTRQFSYETLTTSQLNNPLLDFLQRQTYRKVRSWTNQKTDFYLIYSLYFIFNIYQSQTIFFEFWSGVGPRRSARKIITRYL